MHLADSGSVQNPEPPDDSALEPAHRSEFSGHSPVSLPFFHRLQFKHGAVLSMLMLLAMTVSTMLQVREALREIERGAMEKGRAVTQAVAPLVIAALRHENAAALKPYFQTIEAEKDIDYVQVVDGNGKVLIGSDTTEGERRPAPLEPGWPWRLKGTGKADAHSVAEPWPDNATGVDVFVALLDPEEAARAAPEAIVSARHLRIGVNFNAVLEQDLPRMIWRMIMMTLIVTGVIILAMLLWLASILRPVRELHTGLCAVASGDLSCQVPVYSQDEMGRLAHAFNATIARLRAAFQRIEELAAHDALTRLPNRRVFDEGLNAEAARSRRYCHPFGVIIIDLDRFKDVNDNYGHLAGDDVLRAVGKVIEASVRETDLPARIGGEEFAVILPETERAEVLAVAEKLRQAISSTDFEPAHGLPPGMRMTVSVGAACSGGHLVTGESLVAAADAALYRSKSHGRNLVTMADDDAGKTSFFDPVPGAPDAGRQGPV